MFARASFIPSLCLNLGLNAFGKWNWYDRIDSHVILGALPFRDTVQKVSSILVFYPLFNLLFTMMFSFKLVNQESLGAVVSLNESYELALSADAQTWAKMGIPFLQLPVRDIFQAPDQTKLVRGVDFMRDRIESAPDSSIYVHCKAGRTRSATLVACYLMQKHQWNPEFTVNFLQSKRQQILLHKRQWEALNTFYKEQVVKF